MYELNTYVFRYMRVVLLGNLNVSTTRELKGSVDERGIYQKITMEILALNFSAFLFISVQQIALISQKRRGKCLKLG